MNSRALLAFLACILASPAAWGADAVAHSYPPVIQGAVRAVAIDADGNRYVTGWFSGTKDFNPGIGLDVKKSAGDVDACVTRFNADGSYAWTQTFGGSGVDAGYGVAVSDSTVYVTGYFNSTNAGLGGPGGLRSAGGYDAFILALDAQTGAPVSTFGSGGMETFGGSDADQGSGIATSDSTVYVTGFFSGSDAGVGGLGSIASSGSEDAFILALDARTGVPVSGFGSGGVQKFGGSKYDSGGGIAVSGSTVYVTGYFQSYDAGVGGTGSSDSGGANAFILALDAAKGAAVNGFGLGGVQQFSDGFIELEGYGIAVSSSTVYVTGSFYRYNVGMDAFILALDAGTGAAVSGFGSGGIQRFGGSSVEIGYAVAVSDSTVYATGWFESTDAGVGGSGSISTLGYGDAFILALHASTGAPLSSFGSGGVMTFGGSKFDTGNGIAVSGSTVYVAGDFESLDAGMGGTGNFDSTGFDGFLLPLDAATGAFQPNVPLPPVIISVLPGDGIITGGQSVTITGENLDNTSSAIFGGVAALIVSNTASQIVVTTPAHAAGTVDVVVTMSSGSASLADGFTYQGTPPPAITTVAPNTGPAAGGTSVTITGTNMTGATSVTFGGLPAAITAIDDTTLVVVSPAHAAGLVDLIVDTSAGSTIVTGAYRYNSPPDSSGVAVIMPSPGRVGQPVSLFNVSGGDPDGDITYASFDWGDGTPPSASYDHTYAQAGDYTVTVLLSDPYVTVAAEKIQLHVDAVIPFALKKLHARWVATQKRNADICRVEGTLPALPPSTDFAGQTFSVNVSGAAITYTLDANGKAKTTKGTFPNGALALKLKLRKSQFVGGPLPFSASFKGEFFNVWAMNLHIDPGVSATKIVAPTIDIEFNGDLYSIEIYNRKLTMKAYKGFTF